MSKSFYSYLIDTLLAEHFKNNPAQPGAHYCLLVEDKERRDGILEALRKSQHAQKLIVERIFEGRLMNSEIDRYETIEFMPDCDYVSAPLIVADVDTGGEYLPTIRNAVNAGKKYDEKGTLFILSNYASVDTLSTASINLESPGMPFHIQSIFDKIRTQIKESAALSNNEKHYMRQKLESIRNAQTDDYTLFDFQDVLAVMKDKTLKGHFSDLGFFPDKMIYSQVVQNVKSRAKDNQELFDRVASVMGNLDPDVRKKLLSKMFEDKLVGRLCKEDCDWKEIEFEDVYKSHELRKYTDDLQIKDIKILDSAGAPLSQSSLLIRQAGLSRKQKVETIVCTAEPNVRIRIVFNKGFDRNAVSKGFYEKNGSKGDRSLTITLSDAVSFTVGQGRNKHSFAFAVLNVAKSAFDSIVSKMQLTVSNKSVGEAKITVKAADDEDCISFGSGDREVTGCGVIEWSDDMKLVFSDEDSDDNSQVSRKIIFPGRTTPVEFIVKFDNSPVLNKSAFEIFEAVWCDGNAFSDIRLEQNGKYTYSVIGNGLTECSTPMKNEYRGLLLLEQKMIDDSALAFEGVRIENTDCLKLDMGNVCQPSGMTVPYGVTEALKRLYDYYRSRKTVPTLCPVDNELRILLAAYVDAVKDEIADIPVGQYMTEAQHWLTRLGTVRFSDGRIWLSPFHPIIAAFLLELSLRFDNDIADRNVLRLVGPYYLLPYLTFDDVGYSPRLDLFTEELKTWVCYCPVSDHEQNHAQNIAVKMVKEKMEAFLSQMKFLFPDKECPLIINTFGISDDTHIFKGIIQFVIDQYVSKTDGCRVQRVELHEYVDNLLVESMLEKMNRLGSDALISAELKRIGVKIDLEEFSVREIIHQIFSRVRLYKHQLDDFMSVNYSHLAFYQIRSGQTLRTPDTKELRVEMSLGGLISVPSTLGVNQQYTIGFGTDGLPDECSRLIETAKAMNCLFANEGQGGRKHPFARNLCVAKSYIFKEDTLLNRIYDNSNWVTFLNPEVDLDFFYNQKVYIVYYTDQFSINSRFDSITVTRQVDRYRTLLENSFSSYAALAATGNMDGFIKIVLAYFNSLNGRWLMDISHKQVYQIREKISIVAALKVAEHMLGNVSDTVWIPVSLDEILRVSGSIGLPKDSLFSVKSLKAGGVPMSDDLLMMGCRMTPDGRVTLLLYPVEVKTSKSEVCVDKGRLQVANTCRLLRDNLTGERSFSKDVYRAFFASMLLGNADKLRANRLLDQSAFDRLQEHRYRLLDGDFELSVSLPEEDLGIAALVTINQYPAHNEVDVRDGIPIRHVNININDCAPIIMGTFYDSKDVVNQSPAITDAFRNAWESFRKGDKENEPTADCVKDSDEEALDVEVSKEMTLSDVGTEHEMQADKTVFEADSDSNDVKDCVSEAISVIVGHSVNTGTPVYFFPNDTRQVSHPNLGIIGTMGTGKTQFARSVIAQLSRESVHNVGHKPIGMLVFDYKGDYNKEDFLSVVDGECFNGSFPFNPLKLIVTPSITAMNLPAITADRIADSMRKAFRLGDVQYITIKDAVLDAYAEAGITRDSSTWTKKPPTMSDVVRIYLDSHDARDKVYSIFRNLDDYALFASDNSQCVSLFEWLKSVKVIDLTLFTDNIKKLVVSLILDLFYAEMQQLGESRQENGYREIRAMILVDEAHQFMKMKFNSLRRIISEGRAFGVGMILSTQNLSDFKADEDYATFFKSWVVHGVNNPMRSDLAVVFGATDPRLESYMEFINNAKTFDSICRIGSLVAVIRDLPYFRLLETDPRFTSA